jgi:hypothetical protein
MGEIRVWETISSRMPRSFTVAGAFWGGLALLWTATAHAQGSAPDSLFTEPTPGTLARARPESFDPVVLRSRPVSVALEILDDRVSLNLFPGTSLTATRERVSLRTGSDYTWYGRIEGAPWSQVTLVVQGKEITGNVSLPGKSFQIRPRGGGVHAVREIDADLYPEENPPLQPKLDSIPHATSRAVGGEDDGSVVHVLVVYTQAAANASSNIQAEIQLALDETNTSYANSGIAQRIQLAGSALVNYVESGDANTDLSRLTNFDGLLDEVHDLREQTCADLVSLWVQSLNYCGVGWLMTNTYIPPSPFSFAGSGFNVVKRSCATGNLTFGHELGHNMGAHHDRWASPEDGAFDYSHGFVNPEGFVDPAARWRTVMAYNGQCSSAGFSCTRQQHFSNPDVTIDGDPTGIAAGDPDSADNASTLDNSAFTVANFRSSSLCCSISDPNAPDSDCDGILDDADPCTNRNPLQQTTWKSAVILKNPDEPGKHGLLAKGFFNPFGMSQAVDPLTKGIHFRLEDSEGILYDVSIPPGARSDPSPPTLHCNAKDGWQVSQVGARTIWRYTNVSGLLPAPGDTLPDCTGSAQGVFRVVVKDLTDTSRAAHQFMVKARNGTFPHAPAFPVTLMHADFAVAAQPSPGEASVEAIGGQCAELRFDGAPLDADPPKPFCREVPNSRFPKRIVCRGP